MCVGGGVQHGPLVMGWVQGFEKVLASKTFSAILSLCYELPPTERRIPSGRCHYFIAYLIIFT